MELSPAFKEATQAFVAKHTGRGVRNVMEIVGWDEVLLPPDGPYVTVQAAITYTLRRSSRLRVFYYDGNFSDLMSEIVSLDGGR